MPLCCGLLRMIWTLKKLVARRSARKATAPESGPVQNDAAAEAARASAEPAGQQAVGVDTVEPAGEQATGDAATEPAAERAEAVETAEHAARAEDVLEGAGSATSTDADSAVSTAGAGEATTKEQPAAKPAKRRRAPKLDPLLAADVETARKAVLEIAPENEVGEHAGVKAEDDRVVTHLFESHVRGYKGWQWFAVLARVPRGKVATVSEVGLLPSDRSLLSPEWIPWAERVRPEEKKQAEAEAEAEEAGGDAGKIAGGNSTGQAGDNTGVEQNGGSGGR